MPFWNQPWRSTTHYTLAIMHDAGCFTIGYSITTPQKVELPGLLALYAMGCLSSWSLKLQNSICSPKL